MNKQQEPRLRFKGFAGEWQRATIGELGEIVTGNTPTTSENDNYGNNGLLWVTPTDIKEPITIKTAKQLSEKGKKSARCLPPNSILITCIASIGKNTLIETYGSCNQQINALIPKKECNPYFLLTLSELWSIQMKKIAGSGTMDIVNKTQFSEIRTKLPSSEEQSTIGNFFRRLDSQIAENRAVLEKSRQLKKAMLAKMFPANGEKIPEIRFKGFEGEWKEKSLDELVEQIKSYPLSRNVETLENTGFKYIHYGDIHRGIADIIYSDEVLPNIQAGNFELLKRGDLIIADVSEDYEGVGAACVINGTLKDKVVSGLHTIAIRPNQTNPLFLYYLLKTQAFKQYGRLIGTGTKVVGITASKFLNFQTYIPTSLEQTQIGNFFRQLDETIALQSAEVEKLNQLKKGLLAVMLV